MTSLSLDLDRQLRLAAFDALRRLTEPTDGVITRPRMTAGFEFKGERVPFANRPKGIWKPGFFGRDGAALSISTNSVPKGKKSRYDDQIGSENGWFEYRYQDRDAENADNRAARRAFELRSPLIYFYALSPGRYEAIWPVYVIDDERARHTFRIAVDAANTGDVHLMTGGAEAPLKAYATAMVKRRLHQHRFRELVVSAYGERCTVCQIHHTVLLDAAHILEDHDKRGLPEVPNGLALCKIHHSAYDANIMGIDPDRRIHIREDILDEVDGPMLRHGLQEMNGLSIHVPSRADLKPRREYLGERFERFRAA